MMARDLAHNGMSLAQLLNGIATVPSDVEISDLTLDSRAVTPGALFLAIPGISSHGLQYLERALYHRFLRGEPKSLDAVEAHAV